MQFRSTLILLSNIFQADPALATGLDRKETLIYLGAVYGLKKTLIKILPGDNSFFWKELLIGQISLEGRNPFFTVTEQLPGTEIG